jgi:hypothetical protein
MDDKYSTVVVNMSVAVLTIVLGLFLSRGSTIDEGNLSICYCSFQLTTSFSTAVTKLASSSLMCLVAGVMVAPILKTLTETISTDTVYSMVTIMFLVHLYSFDYGIRGWIVSPAVSTNAATFAGVCLASRLSTFNAFILLILDSDLFVLLSLLRMRWKTTPSAQVIVIWATTLVVSSFTGLSITKPLLWPMAFLLLLVLVNIIFPFLFFRLQGMKE